MRGLPAIEGWWAAAGARGTCPPADIKRLLREKPKAAGIAVPGMVQGSPGMEQGRGKDPYNVVLFNASGRTTIFSAH